MCTAVVSFVPSSPVPVLLAGVRDEFLARPWQPPGRHWPDRPALIGGRDLRAGGTWLAVDTGAHRVACVLNGCGRPAPEPGRLSRGELPLRMATDGKLGDIDPERLDPFHLVCAEPDAVRLVGWDGTDLTERRLEPGLHLVVNSGLEGRCPVHSEPGLAGDPGDLGGRANRMAERIGYFRPLLAAAARPAPWDGPAESAWGAWLPLLDGGGLDRADPRALVIRGDGEDGRGYGTTSTSLVALSAGRIRYDFSAAPGDGGAWERVL
jgi:transport and Golgi organization protein 2